MKAMLRIFDSDNRFVPPRFKVYNLKALGMGGVGKRNEKDCRLWLIVMEFPPNSEPSAQQLGQVYVRTCAKGLDICIEKAQHKINAWSMTTYGGFQLQMTKEESYKFKGLPEVVLIRPILAKGGQAGKGPGQAKSNFMERYHEIITNARFVSNLAIIMFIFGLITIGELLEATKDGNEVNKDDQRQMMLMEEEIHREVRGLVKDLKSLEPEVKGAISQELKSSVEAICDKLKNSLDQVKKEIVDEIVDEVKSSREDVKNSIQSKK